MSALEIISYWIKSATNIVAAVSGALGLLFLLGHRSRKTFLIILFSKNRVELLLAILSLVIVAGAIASTILDKRISELARKELATLNSNLVAAESRVRAMEAQNTPRHLTQEQIEVMVALLRATPGGAARLLYQTGDVEAYAFARKLASVISESGWPAPEIGEPVIMIEAPLVGIAIGVKSIRHAPKYLGSLFAALHSIDSKVMVSENPKVDAGVIEILVGRKHVRSP